MRSHLNIALFCLAGVTLSIAREDQTEEMRYELSLLIRRVNNLEEALKEKDDEIMELQEKIEDLQNPPFGYFCSYKVTLPESGSSIVTYDKLLYSSQFGMQGESPGIDISNGKFTSGISGTWRADFSLTTYIDPPEEYFNIYLHKNGEQIQETRFASYRQFAEGFDGKTGGRSVLLHLDLGDQLYMNSTSFTGFVGDFIFCVSLEEVDV